MNKLEEILNFIIRNRYKSIDGYSDGELYNWIKDNIQQYTHECCKASLEKASEDSIIDGSEFSRCGCEINKESITNTDNIILL